MRLAVIHDQPFWFDGTQYSTNAPFIEFVLSFTECVDELQLYVPVSVTNLERGNYNVNINPKVRIIALPFFANATELYLHAYRLVPKIIHLYWQGLKSWDVAWIVGNHLPHILFHFLAKFRNKKTFFYIRSNIHNEIKAHNYHGARLLAAVSVTKACDWLMRLAISHGTPGFMVGDELFEIYQRGRGKIFPAYPSLIARNNILPEKIIRNKLNGELRLLAVGRLTPEKGLDLLLQTVQILSEHYSEAVKCRIVGAGKSQVPLRVLTAQLGIESQVEFLGFVPPGNSLFAHYDWTDLYVLTSYTEGLPQTIYEAMARGVPIVSTAVGGIPQMLRHSECGVIVEKRDAAALAACILTLAHENQRRRMLSVNGLRNAFNYTIEEQRDRMFGVIKKEIVG